ncbi:MAG: SOS response-associated peptidase [Actinobacteria bacterium]|nr:SOS response-associated peptidase [Actinomycetota bacterium]
MCGRFAQSKMDDALVEEFGINGTVPQSPLPASWNIAPSKEIYIVRDNLETGMRNLDTASWGIIGHWYKDMLQAKASQSHAINARCESVFEKPTFRDSFRKRRCLIPADGYYEWATALGRYKPKQPFYISRQDGGSLSLAGIWSSWTSPEGEVIETAAIITHEAIGFLAPIHSRMPVFMPRDRWQAWLDPQNREIEQLRALMEYPELDGGLQAHAVADSVNAVRNDAPTLVTPILLGEPETLF